MPFVSAAEAPNAHLVEVPFDGPIPADGVHRLPLVGTPSMRHVLLEFPLNHRSFVAIAEGLWSFKAPRLTEALPPPAPSRSRAPRSLARAQ